MIAVYLLIAVLMLLLNALFVLAEFAAVKARPTQIEALAENGDPRAKVMMYIHGHLDQYLSVCQIGITLASIGLGFVGEPAIAALIEPLLKKITNVPVPAAAVHGISVAIAYLVVSFLHIVIGELVPKSIAIRRTERAALLTAYPLTFFHFIFRLPLVILNETANFILRLMRIPPAQGHDDHSEDEVRLILDDSHAKGMMSLRRLLYIENILDMGTLRIRNAMRGKGKVQCMNTGMTRDEVAAVALKYRYSRYPVLGTDADQPLGYVHVKDLFLPGEQHADWLTRAVRPCLQVKEGDHLETVLAQMQSKGQHMAIVYQDNGIWSGMITLEDILEEVVGTIEEEYPVEQRVRLTEILSSPEHVIADASGVSIAAAVRDTLSRIGKSHIPLPLEEVVQRIIEREKVASSCVGHEFAIPHARLKNIDTAFVFFARMKTPFTVSTGKGRESVTYLFILLTPEDQPRIHQTLLSHIARLFSSGYFECRLADAANPKQLFDVICTVEQSTDMTL